MPKCAGPRFSGAGWLSESFGDAGAFCNSPLVDNRTSGIEVGAWCNCYEVFTSTKP
jgi:hypothetical protein